MVNPALRPMTLGEILDRIWWILRQRLRLFAAIGVMPMAATLLPIGAFFGILYALGQFSQLNPAQISPKMGVAIFLMVAIAWIPMLAVVAIFQAAACNAALAVNRGLEITWAGAYRAAWTKCGRFVWLMVLSCLLVSLPMVVLYALFGVFALLAAAQGSHGAWFVFALPLIVMGYIGSAVYMIWMMLRVGLAFPAAVAENIPATQALRRSFLLTRRGKGRMFLAMLVVYAISYAGTIVTEVVIMALAAILGLIGMALHLTLGQPLSIIGMTLGGIVALALFLILMALVYALYAIGLTVLYEDQQLRTDGPPALIGGAG